MVVAPAATEEERCSIRYCRAGLASAHRAGTLLGRKLPRHRGSKGTDKPRRGWAGVQPVRLQRDSGYCFRFCLASLTIVQWQDAGYRAGRMSAETGTWQPMLAGFKHLNRLEQVMLKKETEQAGWLDAVALDVNGDVSGSNGLEHFLAQEARRFIRAGVEYVRCPWCDACSCDRTGR